MIPFFISIVIFFKELLNYIFNKYILPFSYEKKIGNKKSNIPVTHVSIPVSPIGK